jgi:hypothetical protein
VEAESSELGSISDIEGEGLCSMPPAIGNAEPSTTINMAANIMPISFVQEIVRYPGTSKYEQEHDTLRSSSLPIHFNRSMNQPSRSFHSPNGCPATQLSPSSRSSQHASSDYAASHGSGGHPSPRHLLFTSPSHHTRSHTQNLIFHAEDVEDSSDLAERRCRKSIGSLPVKRAPSSPLLYRSSASVCINIFSSLSSLVLFLNNQPKYNLYPNCVFCEKIISAIYQLALFSSICDT